MKSLITKTLVSALAATALLGLAACDEHPPLPREVPSGQLPDIDPRSQVIGVVPNIQPEVTTAATTSSAPSDVGKGVQARSMPLPGQANDHSTPAPNASQKSKK